MLKKLLPLGLAALVVVPVSAAVSSPSAPSRGGSQAASGCVPGYEPVPDPANFVGVIDNPYFPLPVGATFVYRGVRDGETQVDRVYVTKRTKVIEGITATVVRDIAKHGGRLLEKTFDFYAQDMQGNVWYLGENTKDYGPNGDVVSTEGSWESGVHDAEPGIIMEANPQGARRLPAGVPLVPGGGCSMDPLARRGAHGSLRDRSSRATHDGVQPARAQGRRPEVLRPRSRDRLRDHRGWRAGGVPASQRPESLMLIRIFLVAAGATWIAGVFLSDANRCRRQPLQTRGGDGWPDPAGCGRHATGDRDHGLRGDPGATRPGDREPARRHRDADASSLCCSTRPREARRRSSRSPPSSSDHRSDRRGHAGHDGLAQAPPAGFGRDRSYSAIRAVHRASTSTCTGWIAH